MKILVKAAAKINLTLDITGKRPDGYHDLRSVMQSVGLFEYVTLETNDSGAITLCCDVDGIPCDERNIAVKCAREFERSSGIELSGLHIDIRKNIPVQAGLAGGSADGAAVLFGLNKLFDRPLSREELIDTGAKVGADIPFCLTGGTALAEGIGERLTKLENIPDCMIVIVKPSVGISTAQAYSAVDKAECELCMATDRMISSLNDIVMIGKNLSNDFEKALAIEEIKALTGRLRTFDGCLGACMSGSGSAVLSIFSDKEKAKLCAESMSKEYSFAAAVDPVPFGVAAVR